MEIQGALTTLFLLLFILFCIAVCAAIVSSGAVALRAGRGNYRNAASIRDYLTAPSDSTSRLLRFHRLCFKTAMVLLGVMALVLVSMVLVAAFAEFSSNAS